MEPNAKFRTVYFLKLLNRDVLDALELGATIVRAGHQLSRLRYLGCGRAVDRWKQVDEPHRRLSRLWRLSEEQGHRIRTTVAIDGIEWHLIRIEIGSDFADD